MRQYIIDRIEDDIAICQCNDKTMTNIDLGKIPKECKEGNCIVEADDGNIYLDVQETKKREERAKRLLDRLIK